MPSASRKKLAVMSREARDVFRIYCGTENALVYPGNEALAGTLLAKEVDLEYTETDDGSWFIVWRCTPGDFAPLLFQ